jgi:hypothetical protein
MKSHKPIKGLLARLRPDQVANAQVMIARV